MAIQNVLRGTLVGINPPHGEHTMGSALFYVGWGISYTIHVGLGWNNQNSI